MKEHEENVERFFENQKQRVVNVEEKLMKATDFILPSTSESKTITELAELCRLVQEETQQKIQVLKNRLELMGHEWEEEDQVVSPQTPLAEEEVHWSSVGGQLESVIEGDVETEGATTPGSMLHPSPFFSAKKRKESLTPTTPTMDSFSFRYELVSVKSRFLTATSL